MPLYIADYMADAGHLPTIGHGAYMLLLLNYWQRQKPLPADDFYLQGITKLSDSDWERLRPHLAKFFQERDGHWHHKRVDEEIAKANEKIEQARNKGKASAQQRFNRSSTAVEQGLDNSSTIEAKGKGNAALLCSDEQSSSSIEPPPLEIDEKEIERRCEEATGWRALRNIAAITNLALAGVSLEDRILPICRMVSAERRETGQGPPRSWAHVAMAIMDESRVVKPCARPVATVFIIEGSPEWEALCAVKKPSLLRAMLNGKNGIYWPAADMPVVSRETIGGAP